MKVIRTLRLRNGADEHHVLVSLFYGSSQNIKCYYSEVTLCVYDRYLASFSVW